MDDLKDKLIKAKKQGKFLEIVNELKDFFISDNTILVKELTTLHNEGTINIIAEFRKLSVQSQGNDFFFSMRPIFEEVLPGIVAPVSEVMDCVKHLFLESGKDFSASLIFESFMKFCEQDIMRPKEILSIIVNSPDQWHNFITSTIIIGSKHQIFDFFSKTISLSNHSSLEVRLQAIFTLGKIDYSPDQSLRKTAFTTLDNIARSESDPRLLGLVMKSAFSLYLADKSLENNVIQLINKVLGNDDDEIILHAVSEMFHLYSKSIPEDLQTIFLNALIKVNYKSTNSLLNIDYGLHQLLLSNQSEKVVLFLENILSNNSTNLSICNFSMTTHTFLNKNREILNFLVTKWFLSKKISLCKAIQDLFGKSHEDGFSISADINLLKDQPEGTCLYLVRKAIGWLFLKPSSCISFIISLIEISSTREDAEISKLIFNPLLINFPGKINQFLLQKRENSLPKTVAIINKALDKNDKFQQDIKSVTNIPELLPSQSQREIYYRHSNQQFEKSFKLAEKNSLIGQIATRSVILYGQKSINYIRDLNNVVHRTEIPLKCFEHSIEIPNQAILDPHALEYILYVFRSENCIKENEASN